MSLLLSLTAQILHIGLMLLAAPLLAGFASWCDARLADRSGPPLLLPWHDLIRWSRKTPALAETASAVSRFGPLLALATTLTAIALVPSFTLDPVLSPLADVLVIATLLIGSRITVALVALDSGTAPQGLAQQRHSARAVLADPALILALIALGITTGTLNLDRIVAHLRDSLWSPAATTALALAALIVVAIAEAAATDTETDAMFAGTDLAMLRLATWLRRLLWLTLIANLALPFGLAEPASAPAAWLIALAAWVAKIVALTFGLSLLQARLGRLSRDSLPHLLGLAALLATLAVTIALTSGRPA